MKNLVTVRAGHNNVADAMPDQPVSHIIEPGQKRLLSSKIVGGFMAAIQDHAEMRDLFFKMLIDLPRRLWSGAGQGASRKEDSIAASWQTVPGKETGAAAAFIFEDGSIMFRREFVVGHDLTAHLQK
jgi:hypothetical protein